MGTFIIIETTAYDTTYEVEASTIEEARRLFEAGETGEEIDRQPIDLGGDGFAVATDQTGISQIIDPCGETVYEALSPAERAIRSIHAALDGKEWTPEHLDWIAGEIEAVGLKIRSPLIDCDLCDQREVEDDAEQYTLPIDLHGPDDEYLAEAGDHLNVCPQCIADVEAEAERNRRGL